MATNRSSSKGANNGADGQDDFKPSPREALHMKKALCEHNLARVKAAIPLEIRSSNISEGSGLFVAAEIDAGHEIYHVNMTMAAIDPDNESFCHYCFKDTFDRVLRIQDKTESKTKTCSACKSARFCSKKCQKKAWDLYHRDECKVLQGTPRMAAQDLLAHRLLFWQQRGYVQTAFTDSIMCLETHFDNISKDPERSTALMAMATEVRKATDNKVQLSVPWKLIPAMHINCVPLRPASTGEFVGHAFEVVTAMINHSCDPNALVFFEGQSLRVRSLKKISAGEEITMCYTRPTLYTAARQGLLKQVYYFDCSCSRCNLELKQQRALLGGSDKLSVLHRAQKEIVMVIKSATRASDYPGVYPKFEDLSVVEEKLRTVTAGVFPADKSWPEYMEPLPSARLSLAMLHLHQGKPVPALRNALMGQLLSTRNNYGPEWTNDMIDVVVAVLMVVGSLPPDAPAFKNKDLPPAVVCRTVTYGYLFALRNMAKKVFGEDVGYTKVIQNITGVLLQKKPGAKPGSDAFLEEFESAQRNLLAWAGVPEENAVPLTT